MPRDRGIARRLARGLAKKRKGPLPATRVFDQLYFVGDNSVSAWAIDTPEGIVLFDALNGPEDVAGTIVPGRPRRGESAFDPLGPVAYTY